MRCLQENTVQPQKCVTQVIIPTSHIVCMCLCSVLIVLGVGCTILEAASHAPLLGLFMPRVLQVSGLLWLLMILFRM